MISKISSNSLMLIKKIPRSNASCGSQCGSENIFLDITLEHSEVTYPGSSEQQRNVPTCWQLRALEELDGSKSDPHCSAALSLCFLFPHLLSKGNTYSDQRHPHGLIWLNQMQSVKPFRLGTISLSVGTVCKNTRTIRPVRLRTKGINSQLTESKVLCA